MLPMKREGIAAVFIPKKQLLDFIRLCAPSVDRKLAQVIFTQASGKLYISYLDRKVSIIGKFERLASFDPASSKSISVQFKDFEASLKASEGMISLDWDSDRLYMQSDTAMLAIPGKDDCFIPAKPEIHTDKIPSRFFLDSLPTALKIITEKSSRLYGTVAKLESMGTDGALIATDGYRIAVVEQYLAGCHNGLDGTCLDVNACKVLLLAAKSKEELSIGLSEDKTTLALMIGESAEVFFRLPSIKYPAYREVLPTNTRGQNFLVQDLKLALACVLAITGKKDPCIGIMSVGGKMILRGKRNKEDTQYSIEQVCPLPCEFILQKEVRINGSFLMEALEATTYEKGTIRVTGGEATICVSLGYTTTVIMLLAEQK